MSRNIYDIFNAKKEGLDYLSESYGNNVNPYEDLEDGIRDLDMIVHESTMELIELEGAIYLEDLVLENMMYENFDEEQIAPILEGKMKEMGGNLVAKIQNLWTRIKEWFKKMFETIKNFFMSNKKLVLKYQNVIPEKMRNCDKEMKLHDWQDPAKASDEAEELCNHIYDQGTDYYNDKDALLKAIGVEDAKKIVELTKEMYMGKAKAETRKVSSLNPDVAMDYVLNEKIFLDLLKQTKIEMDNKFKEVLSEIQDAAKDKESGKSERKDARKIANVFQFAVNMKTKVLNTAIACVKKGSHENRAAILKALNKGGNDEDKEAVGESYNLFYNEDLYKF